MTVEFKYEEIKKSKCQIIEQGICPDTFDDSALPTDVHIVTYTVGGDTYHDAVRAHSMADIFDMWYDKLKGIGNITKIRSGIGRIKPNLYGKIKPKNQLND